MLLSSGNTSSTESASDKKIVTDTDRQRLSHEVLTNQFTTKWKLLEYINATAHFPISEKTLGKDIQRGRGVKEDGDIKRMFQVL